MAAVRVVLANSNPNLREGLKSLLRHADQIEIIGEAQNGMEAIEIANQLVPGVLVLDLGLPILNGLDVIRTLHETRSPVRVVGLCVSVKEHQVRDILTFKDCAYLTKEEVPEYLEQAILSMSRGEEGWLSPSVGTWACLLQPELPPNLPPERYKAGSASTRSAGSFPEWL